MKASEAIKELQELIEKFGDREIVYDYGCEIEGFDPDYCVTSNGFSQDLFNVIG